MGLNLNGTGQWLQAAWSPGAVQPMTFMAWVRRDTTSQHLSPFDGVVKHGR